jgi:hypothetical protein
MSTNIVYNGVTYTIPATSDVDWGEAVSNFLIAIPSGMLTKVGGAWALTDSDLDFGSAYGLVAKYYKSKSATPAQAGALRLALADKVAWRSDGNDKDLVLGPNTSDGLVWDGVELDTISGTKTLTNKTIDTATNTITNLRDANIAADALIAWSKIAFSGDFGSTSVITTGGVKLGDSFHVTLQADPSEDYDFVFPATDGTSGQALVKSVGGDLEWATIPGLALDAAHLIVGSPSDLPFNVDTSAAGDILAGSVAGLTIKSDVITNLMIKSDAAIALSKLAALTASRAVVTDASGFITVSTVTATELGWVSGVTSGIQGQFNSITTNVTALQGIVSDSKEPMGLVVLPTPPTVTYEGARQIKIAHPFSYYFKGTKVNSIADVTVTVPNTTGAYYLVFTNSGLTAAATTTVDILNQVVWAAFYWNATTSDYIFFEERHGISWTANEHKQAHLTRGAAYESGGAISGYVLASDALADIQIAIDATNFWDEDIRNALAAKLEGSNFDKWYRSGASGDWRKDASDTIPAFWAGTPPNGVAQINTTGGSWALNPVTNGNYFNCYIFATNSAESANRFILIPGQNQAGTLSGAQAFSISTLSLGSLPVQEILPLYKVTLRYRTINTNNNARVTIEAVEDIRRTTSPGVSAGVSGTHNSLSGRSDADSHPTAAITGLNGETASDTVRVTLPQDTKANLDALTRKKGTLVYATDLNTLFADDGSNLSAAGSGSGAGRKNYIQNPSAALSAATNWTISNTTDFTVTRDTTTNIPRETTTGTAFKLVSKAINATFTSAARMTDDADAAKRLAGEIAINVATASNWTIEVQESADGTTGWTKISMTTDVAGVTTLPATVGTFKFAFDTRADKRYIRVQIKSAAAADTTAYFSDILLTPDGSTINSAVVQSPLTATGMVASGVAAGYSIIAKYTRWGSRAKISGLIALNGANTTTVIVGMPTGMTIDQSALPPGLIGTQGYQLIGEASFRDANLTNLYNYQIYIYGTTNAFYFLKSNALPEEIDSTKPVTAAAGDVITFNIDVPISEFADGTVNVAGNDVEYASVGGTWDENSTTTVYGQGGSLMGGALTAGRLKTITWQYPIQQGDMIIVEASQNQVQWFLINGARIGSSASPVVPSINSDFSSNSGVQWYQGASNRETVVLFSTYKSIANDDSPATDWDSAAAYWRVRKVSASSVAGFEMHKPGVSAGLVPAQGLDGRTDGVAVPAGKVGEYKEVEATNTNNATSSWVDVTGLSIALTPGEWVIGYAVVAAVSGSATYITNVGIITGTSTIVSKTVAAIVLPTGATSGMWVSASRQTKVTVNTTTTYKVAIRSGNAGTTIDVYGNSNTGGLSDPDNNSVMWAHRIA